MALTDVTNSDAPTQVDLGPPQPLQLPPYYVAAPGMASQPAPEPVQQPQVVDRQAYWTNQWDQMRQQNEALQAQRDAVQTELTKRMAPFQPFIPQVNDVLAQNQRGQMYQQQTDQQSFDTARQNPPTDAEAVALLARGDQHGLALYQRATAPDATPEDMQAYQRYNQQTYAGRDEAQLNTALALPGELAKTAAAPATNLLPKGIPGVPGVNPQGIAEGVVGTVPYAAEAAVLGPAAGTALFGTLGASSEQQAIEQYRAGNISGLKLTALTAANILPLIAAGAPALSHALNDVLQRLGGMELTAGNAPRIIIGTGGDRPVITDFPESNAWVISGVKPSELAAFRLQAEKLMGRPIAGGSGDLGFVNAPEPSKIPGGMTAADEFAAAKKGTAGGALRAVVDLGAKVDAALSNATDARIVPAVGLAKWFSPEADRFTSETKYAVSLYRRDLQSASAFGAMEGRKAGAAFDKAFPGGADGEFISPVTKQPVVVKGLKLTNADVAEASHHLNGLLSSQQLDVLKAIKTNEGKLIAPARAEGANVGQARSVFGDPVSVYIPRTMTSIAGKSGERVFSGELQNHGTATTSLETSREHVTRAEGHAAAVKYAKSTTEEFSRHYQSVGATRALLALKTRLDQQSQTLRQRLVERNPSAANAPAIAAQGTKAAKELLRQRTSTVRIRNIKTATRNFRDAKKAVLRAQRMLERATIAPKLEQSRTTNLQRQRLINEVGRAREAFSAAQRELTNATSDTLDLLKGRLNEADRNAILEAQEMVKQGVEGQKAARKTYQAGMKAVQPNANEIMSPGNMSITQGRIFDATAAQPLLYMAKTDSVHAVITALSHATLPLRFALATLDNSFVLNQAWNFMLASPHRWLSMFVKSWGVAANDGLYGHWLNNHREAITALMKNAPDVFENADFAPRGSVFAVIGGKAENLPVVGLAAKVAFSPVKLADRAFTRARVLTAVSLWELWHEPGMTPEQEYSLGSTVTKMAGTSRTAGPESALAFAARNARAQIGLGLDALTHSGVQGAKARNIVMRQILAATAFTVLAGLIAKKTKKEIEDSINPTLPGSFHVGGFDLWGANRPLMNLVTSFGDSVRWDVQDGTILPSAKWFSGPLGNRYLRAKSNPLIGKFLNAVQGENSIGQPTNFRNEFLNPMSYAPITIQAAKQDIGRGGNPWIAIPAEITGGRYSVPTGYQALNNRLGELNIPAGQFFSERGTRDQLIADHPELQKLYDTWRESRKTGSIEQRAAEQIISDKEAQIRQVLDAVHAGQLAPDQIRSKIGDINSASNAIRNALLPDATTHASRLDPLYALYDAPENQDPAGGPDMQKVNDAIEAKLKENPELRGPWEANQFIPVTNDPLEIALKNAQRIVNDKQKVGTLEYSYFGVNNDLWDGMKSAYSVLKGFDTSEEYQRARSEEALKLGQDPADRLAKDPYWKKFSDSLTVYHHTLLDQQPAVAAALRVFYGLNIPDKSLSQKTMTRIDELTQQLYVALGIRETQ